MSLVAHTKYTEISSLKNSRISHIYGSATLRIKSDMPVQTHNIWTWSLLHSGFPFSFTVTDLFEFVCFKFHINIAFVWRWVLIQGYRFQSITKTLLTCQFDNWYLLICITILSFQRIFFYHSKDSANMFILLQID